MDLAELRTVQTRERATEGLQELRDSFYADVAEYIESLREERDEAAAQADDPFRSPRVTDLTDEIETAEEVAEAIYERRIGKLVKRASLAASGMPDDQEGLTAEEQELYDTLVDLIEQNKTQVLETLTGDRPPGAAATHPTAEGTEDHSDSGGTASSGGVQNERAEDTPEPPADTPPGDQADPEPPADTSASAVMEGEAEMEESGDEDDPDVAGDGGPAAPAIDRTKVRVTEDVGEIFGIDEREYTLQTDDVVHLPTENATPLIDRDAAERLE